MRISLNTNIMIDTSRCLGIKILRRILFSQQNFVRILISQQNFVSNRHHYLHLPLSRYQNSASNFVFSAEFCQNSDITAEFCLNTDIIIYTFPCLQIKILLRILFFQQNFVSDIDMMIDSSPCRLTQTFMIRHLPLPRNQNSTVRILLFQQNFVSYRHDDRHLPLSRNQNSA